jgi:hypothetical protein
MATTAEPRTFATIDEPLVDFRAGRFVVVVDAPDRENEGDLTIAAEFATLTNNPRKMESAVAYGLMVTEQVPIEVPPNAQNVRYLQTKRAKLGHRLHHQDLKFEPEEQ